MSEFSFEYPEAFLLFLIYIICQYFCKKRVKTVYFPHLELFSKTKVQISLKNILKYLIAFFIVFSLASPVFIDHRNPANRNGFDISLCIDSSGSMGESGFDKENSNISKFDSVKEAVKEFILKRRNDNIALIFFGDFAYIASPLTYEKEALSEFVDVQDMALAGKNTAIGDGLITAIDALKTSIATTKIIILLTDGKHNAGSVSVQNAVEIAKKNNIKIYTIGVGEDIDVAMLEKIALESGAKSFLAKDIEKLKEVYGEIDGFEKSILKSKDYSFKEYLFFYSAVLAFALLFFYFYLFLRRAI